MHKVFISLQNEKELYPLRQNSHDSHQVPRSRKEPNLQPCTNPLLNPRLLGTFRTIHFMLFLLLIF